MNAASETESVVNKACRALAESHGCSIEEAETLLRAVAKARAETLDEVATGVIEGRVSIIVRY